jgi:hypothetical protein
MGTARSFPPQRQLRREAVAPRGSRHQRRSDRRGCSPNTAHPLTTCRRSQCTLHPSGLPHLLECLEGLTSRDLLRPPHLSSRAQSQASRSPPRRSGLRAVSGLSSQIQISDRTGVSRGRATILAELRCPSSELT